jgi:ornithine carbamoyltransferase
MLGSALVGLDMVACCPEQYLPDEEITTKSRELAEKNNCKVEVNSDPNTAVADADIIYTDTWISMGDDAEAAERERAFTPYQVNSELVRLAKSDYIFMHCLPAHRNQEVTDDVMDSDNSVIFDQAENRLHAQKALMLYLMDK